MDAADKSPPRRVIDARFDYDRELAGINSAPDQANRAILLRLINGAPPNYLVAMGPEEIPRHERDDVAINDWYTYVELKLKSPTLMRQFKLKADFFRETWANMTKSEQNGMTRDDWVKMHLGKEEKEWEQEDGCSTMGIPISEDLREKFDQLTHPEAYEKFLQAAEQERLAEDAESLVTFDTESQATFETESQATERPEGSVV